MNPIAQEEANRKAIYWKADEFARSFDRVPATAALHRFAGVRSWSANPKRSAVDGNYFAEVNFYVGQGVSRINVKLGTGPTPLHAALDGYRQVMPEHAAVWAAYALEIECEMLRRAFKRERELEARIDKVLEDLTKIVRSFNVPLPAKPGEDDDL